jgi:hypothetical protein
MQQEPVYTLFLGPNVKQNNIINTHINHYNLLHTVEDYYHLGTLGRCDETSTAITGFLKIRTMYASLLINCRKSS